MDRYPMLLSEIFQKHLQPDCYLIDKKQEKTFDMNYLHGIFQVITCLFEKHKIFQFISFDEFMAKLKPFLEMNQ